MYTKPTYSNHNLRIFKLNIMCKVSLENVARGQQEKHTHVHVQRKIHCTCTCTLMPTYIGFLLYIIIHVHTTQSALLDNTFQLFLRKDSLFASSKDVVTALSIFDPKKVPSPTSPDMSSYSYVLLEICVCL